MKKYMLISIVEREMIYEFFDTLEDAQEEMKKQANNSCIDIIDYIHDQMAQINETDAWVTDGNNHDDYDWWIVEI